MRGTFAYELATLKGILESLDDVGACECREKASIGVIYPCEHCLVTEGLLLVDRIELQSSPVSRSTDA